MDVPPFVARLLGLPDEVAEPTAYQLLGLDPRRFAPGQVGPALEERKRRLRHNIPGPQFIPIISRFEQELDRVAALLLDPAQRRAYDEGLRRDVAAHARRLHHQPVPSRSATPPTPAETETFFATAADLTIRGGALSPEDESGLRSLAAKLGLADERAAALLDERLRAKGAARQSQDLTQQQEQFEREVRALYPDGVASPASRADLIELAAARGLPAAAAGEALDRCFSGAAAPAVPAEHVADADEVSRPGRFWAWIPPVAAVAVLTALVFLYAPSLLDEEPPPRTFRPTPPPPASQVAPTTATRPSPPTATAPSPTTAAAPRPTTASPSPTTAVTPKPTTSAPPTTPTIVLPSPEAIAKQLEPLRLVLKLTDTDVRHELLADLAVITLTSADAAAHFAGQPNRWATDLATVLRQADRVDYLAGLVELPRGGMAAPTVPTGGGTALEPKRRDELRQALTSSSAGARYRAIDELRASGTPDAAGILVEGLAKVAATLSSSMSGREAAFAARLLRALGDVSDGAIPSRIAALIPKAKNSIVPSQISRTLELWIVARIGDDAFRRIAGSYERSRTLPRLHSASQRSASGRAWRATLAAVSAYRARGGPSLPLLPYVPPQEPATPSRPRPDWEPPPTPLKLLAVTEFYARHTADLLSESHWPTKGSTEQPLGPRPPTRAIVAPVRAGQSLVEALEAIVRQLNRLVREHPTARRQSLRADLIEQEMRARSLASDTALQRAAVALDAAAALLELLVAETSDDNGMKAVARAVARERRRAVAAAPNVAQELREAAFHQFACWKLLLRPQEGATP